ncbi:MAG: hypothetical protein HY719_10125, partial [Planctomycetes bacterium]|nr:hypothetical protein [Planctomycetota bacterium]
LPRLLERSGQSPKGAITAMYTVLVEGDDVNDPIADAVRGILDGHIWLARKIANRGLYPAIDVLESISRCAIDVTAREHQEAALRVKELTAVFQDAEDLVNIGAYAAGSNPKIDEAIRMRGPILDYLKQWYYESFDLPSAIRLLLDLFPDLKQRSQPPAAPAPSAQTVKVQRKDGAPPKGPGKIGRTG